MKVFAAIILILSIVMTPTVPCLAQDPGARDDETIVVGSTEVLLDAVVKDKRGRVVKDLKPSDFEVWEDGVRQEIRSFRLVTRGPEAAGNAARAGDAPGGSKTPAGGVTPVRTSPSSSRANRLSAVALVFDRLSPEGRARARSAALSYVGDAARPDDFVGVFGIDLSLRAVQPFTNDGRLVRQAVDRVAAHGTATHTAATGQITDVTQKQSALESQVAASGSAAPGAGQAAQGSPDSIGFAAAEAEFAEMTRRAVEGFEILERSQQGHATTDALLAVVNAMGRLPGRKALIFFSEGVAIPTQVQSQFRNVISAANRANVSIYSVDAAGLRAQSSDAEAGRALTALGRRRVAVAGSPGDGDGPMTRDLERNEDLMRLNPEGGLSQLASETGGLFVGGTNDPAARLRQVDEDLHAYYLLTYGPRNQNFDGQFRQISLKVNRPGVEVQARKGYYAFNVSFDTPVLHYEVPALTLLGGARRPNAFDSKVAAFSFPEPGKPDLVPVMVEVPAGSVNFTAGKDGKTYSTNFSVVVLVKNEAGRVVRKLSNQYLLGGPLDKLDAARRGKILFYRETQLEPGRYTIAAAVYDATNERASVNEGTLAVPAADESRLRLSSVVIIKSAEQAVAADKRTPNPFHFGDVLIYPNMGEPLRKSESKNLTFFVTAYAPGAAAGGAKLKLEITRQGRAIGQSTYDLPAPDAAGRIQYAGAIPTDKFDPGEYELKVTVQDARDTATRSAKFTITP
jgi:VWFA-related protein